VLGWAMSPSLGLVVAEIFGGILGRSVALLNDAVHNLSDSPPLAFPISHALGRSAPPTTEKLTAITAPGTLAATPTPLCSSCFPLWLGL